MSEDEIQVKLKECNFIYPCMEDVYNLYSDKMSSILFPENIKYKYLVYFINLFHIFGVIMIQIGIFFPPKYMPFYLIYIVLLLAGYKLLENNCFMTVLSNYYGETNENPLYIRMETARNLVIKNVIIAVYNYLIPEYSLYSIIKKIFNSLDKIPIKVFSIFLAICLVFLSISMYLVKSGKYNKLKNFKD